MEIIDLAKEYLILRKIQASIEKKQEENVQQLSAKPEDKDRLSQTEQYLDKRLEANKARQDKVWSEIKGNAKKLLVEHGRGVLELTQQGVVIAALATGAPHSDKLMKDLLDTRPEEIEYAAELITEQERRKNQELGKNVQTNKDPDPKLPDGEREAIENAKKQLLNEHKVVGAKNDINKIETNNTTATEKAKQMLLDKKLDEEVKKSEELKRQEDLRKHEEQLQRDRAR